MAIVENEETTLELESGEENLQENLLERSLALREEMVGKIGSLLLTTKRSELCMAQRDYFSSL